MFDFYASLADQTACPPDGKLPFGLASGFLDGCTSFKKGAEGKPDGNKKKRDAETCYRKRAGKAHLRLPKELELDATFTHLPDPSWVGLEVSFVLETPWYSKDDRPFHVLDNPVRKDRVFGVPFMAAASWKGLLRWSCRMSEGLLDYLERHGGKLDGWNEPPWILHLFGNKKGEGEDFQRGVLAFYPTWFDKVGFEVINPHSRKTRAGTNPISYEVVPTGTEGALRLLYGPTPGAAQRDQVEPAKCLVKLLNAVEALLVIYGMSAKRTAGWGTARPTEWTAYRHGRLPFSAYTAAEFEERLPEWLTSAEGAGG